MPTHIQHVEDLIFDGLFLQAFDTISALDEALRGEVVKSLNVSTKYDGAPAIIFGYHPDDGRRFIGTKSALNKHHPRVAYDKGDIERLYGNIPDVAAKLTAVWDNLTSFPLGIWHADLMWYPNSTEVTDNFFSFTPNTIKYSTPRDDYDFAYLERCNVGLAVHSFLSGDTLSDLHSRPVNEFDFLKADWYVYPNDVYFIQPTYKIKVAVGIADGHLDLLSEHMDVLDSMHVQNLDAIAFADTMHHTDTIKMFINYCVRMGEASPSIDMYRTFLVNRNEEALVEHLDENASAFETMFTIHERLTAAKKLIIEMLSVNSRFLTSVDGQPTCGEGFVVSYYGAMVKLVDRLEFSRLNFMNKRFENAVS